MESWRLHAVTIYLERNLLFYIEEDSFADTIPLVGDRLGHFHVESPNAYAERKAEVVRFV